MLSGDDVLVAKVMEMVNSSSVGLQGKVSTLNRAVALLGNKAVEFETDPIKLEKASLDPGWYYANGASSRAQDKVVGVWFKAFDSTGKQIGEYTNPASVAQKQKWKD